MLDYRPEDNEWNPIVCGALVGVIGILRATGLRWIMLRFIGPRSAQAPAPRRG